MPIDFLPTIYKLSLKFEYYDTNELNEIIKMNNDSFRT